MKLTKNIATLFGLGYLPKAPGTYGSIAGLVVCLLVHGTPWLNYLLFVIFFSIGVIASDKMEKEVGEKDPGYIIIDEFACILLIYISIPLNMLTILVGFTLFRLIDIFKIPPMRTIEKRFPGGWGIMLDDLVAAIYTNLILHVLVALIYR